MDYYGASVFTPALFYLDGKKSVVYLEKKRKMKIRPFNVFDGLFLVALYFKLSGQGPAIAWWEVFAPYMVEAVITIVGSVVVALQWHERIKYFLWKKAVGWRMKKLAKKAKTIARRPSAVPTTGNPGRAHDRELFPNQKAERNG
jgi:hypothetical protein